MTLFWIVQGFVESFNKFQTFSATFCLFLSSQVNSAQFRVEYICQLGIFSCPKSSLPTFITDWVNSPLTIQRDRRELPYTRKLEVIWDPTTSNLLVYSFQLPLQKRLFKQVIWGPIWTDRTGKTQLTLKLDFPEHLWRADFAILAMFEFPTPGKQFEIKVLVEFIDQKVPCGSTCDLAHLFKFWKDQKDILPCPYCGKHAKNKSRVKWHVNVFTVFSFSFSCSMSQSADWNTHSSRVDFCSIFFVDWRLDTQAK